MQCFRFYYIHTNLCVPESEMPSNLARILSTSCKQILLGAVATVVVFVVVVVTVFTIVVAVTACTIVVADQPCQNPLNLM